MNDDQNPYSSPDSAVATQDDSLANLVSAQKLAIYGMLGYLAVMALGVVPLLAIVQVAVFVLVFVTICVATAKIGRALGAGWFVTILYLLCMLIPLIGLLVLAVLNSRATKRLKAGGYEVGFLGVKGSR